VIEDDITSQKGRYYIEGRKKSEEKNGEIEMPVTVGPLRKRCMCVRIRRE
jgi:hypothetical protein